MSIFASYVTRVIPLPFDEPHEVTIQKLSAKHLAAARQASVAASLEAVKAMGDIRQELSAVTPAAVAGELEQRQRDPIRQYDRGTLLAKGIKAWTYQEPVTVELLDDLDEQAADYLARAILALTLPNGDGAAAEKKAPPDPASGAGR